MGQNASWLCLLKLLILGLECVDIIILQNNYSLGTENKQDVRQVLVLPLDNTFFQHDQSPTCHQVNKSF